MAILLILQVLFRSWLTTPILYHNFEGFSFAPDRPCWGQPEQKPWTIRSWSYFEFSKYSNLCDHVTWTLEADRQTHGWTDRRHTVACALLAPHGKNGHHSNMTILLVECIYEFIFIHHRCIHCFLWRQNVTFNLSGILSVIRSLGLRWKFQGAQSNYGSMVDDASCHY